MQCREFQQIADSYLAGELLVETTHEVLHHLETCPVCRDDLAARRRLREGLRGAFTTSDSLRVRPEFLDDLAAGLHARATRVPSARWARLSVLAAAAVVLLTAAVTLYVWRSASVRRAIERPAELSARLVAMIERLSREAAGDHRDCALEHRLAEAPIPLEDAARLYDAAYGSLSEVVEGALEAAGALPGGPAEIVDAHSCVLGGRRFAHVILEYRGQLVSVLVTDPPASDVGAGPAPGPTISAGAAQDGFRIAWVRAPRHIVFVVSELETADVNSIAQAVSGPVYRHLGGA